MRIRNEIKKSGYFWLPSTPENKIPGTLSMSDGGNIELEVVGLFDESIEALNNNYDFERIVGHIEKEGLITLDDCFYTQKNFAFGGISKSLVHVNKAFIGVAYEEGERVSFNTFKFSIEGIDEWVGISGINVDNQYKEKTTTITYLPPEDISINLNNGMNLLITFSWTLPGLPSLTNAKITQKIYFKLVSREERELSDFITIAHRITTLLCFAIDQTVCVECVTATSDNIRENITNEKSWAVQIKVFYPSVPFSKDEPKIKLHQMLFRYGNIKSDAEIKINNWIDAYNEIEPAISLYFSTKTGAQRYLSGKFLALAQGLETYHRRTSEDKLMDERIFKNLVKGIIAQCPKDNRKWLAGRLKHGNEINFGKRIKSIIEPFKEVVGTNSERSKMIRSIVDTRNFLTHYDESLKPNAASGMDLRSLCLKMEAFYQLHFLKILGFTQEEIKTLLKRFNQLQNKL